MSYANQIVKVNNEKNKRKKNFKYLISVKEKLIN